VMSLYERGPVVKAIPLGLVVRHSVR